jgi:D-alanyl-D-alanine carboxypeptidase/D-alanyl-D-alanine-endopeptidase (penicillin-binding protein 4)
VNALAADSSTPFVKSERRVHLIGFTSRAAFFCLVAASLSQSLASAAEDTNSLHARIAAHISQPRFASALWGVKVASLDTGRTLFEHNADKLMKPASNAKLYTGALALDRLGPDFRIKTSLYAAARPSKAGTLNGDLIVYGRGDPSCAARFQDGNYTHLLDPLADALVVAGVKRIKGDLVGDESYFRGPPMGSGWTWDDLQYYYGAEVSALTIQDNVIDLVFKPGKSIGEPCAITPAPATDFVVFFNRTGTGPANGLREINLYRPIGENLVYVSGSLPLSGSNHTDAVAVHDPARWYLTLFKETLLQRGIRVSGKLRTVNWLDRELEPLALSKLIEIGSVRSRPLSEIVDKMMKPSQNLYAQLLLLHVAANSVRATNAPRNQTTEEIGVAELQDFLATSGIKKGEVLLEEGSGLSRGALLTPNATVELLKFMSRHRHAAVFRDALPIAGVDGTLRSRMKGTRAEGNVRAKTGSLRYVNTLSGYVTTAAGERLAFSIMLNNHNPDPAFPAPADVDAIAILLARLDQPVE